MISHLREAGCDSGFSFAIQASDVHMYVLVFSSSLERYAQFRAAARRNADASLKMFRTSLGFWPNQG
jgi:hypothetical protein